MDSKRACCIVSITNTKPSQLRVRGGQKFDRILSVDTKTNKKQTRFRQFCVGSVDHNTDTIRTGLCPLRVCYIYTDQISDTTLSVPRR